MNKLTAVIALPTRFLWALITSGLQTVGTIVRQSWGGASPAPSTFLRIDFAPLDERGAVLLGCMISLTPGTTVIDIDMAKRQMVLHLLDGEQTTPTMRTIRQHFEPPLQAWFGVPT